jgi:hypothetical protein
MKDLPKYKLILEDDLEAGLSFVSLVKDPAIGLKGLAFADNNLEFKFNEDKQVIAGVAMIPDQLIYRNDPELGEFYVYFTAEEIQKFVAKFNKSSKTYKVNLDHSTVLPDSYIAANWIIESEFDKSKYYGFENLPLGSWFVEIKVDDPEVWATQVKQQGKFGFSVEGMFGLELSFNKQNKNETMNKLKFAEAKLEDGTTIYTSGLEVGAEVYVIDENLDKVPVFDGEHILADGSVVVTVDGKITEIKPKAQAEEMAEEVPAEASAKVEPVELEITALDEVRIMELIQPKFDELYATIAELKTLLEKESIEEEVEVELKKEKFSAVDALIRLRK